jgi:hypothetical protein
VHFFPLYVRCPSPIGYRKIHLLLCRREVGHKLIFVVPLTFSYYFISFMYSAMYVSKNKKEEKLF